MSISPSLKHRRNGIFVYLSHVQRRKDCPVKAVYLLRCPHFQSSDVAQAAMVYCDVHFFPPPSNLSFFEEEKVILVVFSLVGFLFFDMVYMAAVMNYVVQSELLVWLVSSVTTLLYKNEYPNIDAGIKVRVVRIQFSRLRAPEWPQG